MKNSLQQSYPVSIFIVGILLYFVRTLIFYGMPLIKMFALQ